MQIRHPAYFAERHFSRRVRPPADQSHQAHWTSGSPPGSYCIASPSASFSPPTTSTRVAMASIIRPSLLRQACIAAPAKRIGSSAFKPVFASAFSTSSTSRTRQPAAQTVKPSVSRSVFSAAPKAAAFHTTSKREILPPLPRGYSPKSSDDI